MTACSGGGRALHCRVSRHHHVDGKKRVVEQSIAGLKAVSGRCGRCMGGDLLQLVTQYNTIAQWRLHISIARHSCMHNSDRKAFTGCDLQR